MIQFIITEPIFLLTFACFSHLKSDVYMWNVMTHTNFFLKQSLWMHIYEKSHFSHRFIVIASFNLFKGSKIIRQFDSSVTN